MYNQLTREQRYAIYLGIQEGKTQTAIARQICVNRSTVCREIRRNSNRQGKYWWSMAHERAMDSSNWTSCFYSDSGYCIDVDSTPKKPTSKFLLGRAQN